MMVQQVVEAKKEQNVVLAFMECFTSCVLTYLNIRGKDYKKVLLDYWNLSYQFKTLMSAKEARQLPLEYFYGLKMMFVKGDEASLRSYIRSGCSVICLCTASKLNFFPRSYLGMESSGFQHSILLYGWDERQELYLVMDPVVNAVVSLKPDELVQASVIREGSTEMHYFVLEETTSLFAEPDLKSILSYCAARNLALYRNERTNTPASNVAEKSSDDERKKAWLLWFQNRHSGVRALTQFEDDVLRSPEWDVRRRNDWIGINTKTIASIRHVRTLVWNAYRDFADFAEMQLEEGQRQIEAIQAEWNTLNFLMLKYKSGRDSGSGIPPILKRIQELKRVELQFLEWLYQAVRE